MLYRKVFDIQLDTLPTFEIQNNIAITCDVCMKKDIEKTADVYCTTCCQKYCTQHQQVGTALE